MTLRGIARKKLSPALAGVQKRRLELVLKDTHLQEQRFTLFTDLSIEDAMELKFYHRDGGGYPNVGQVFDAVAEVSPGQDDAQRYELYVCSALYAIAQIPEQCDQLLEAIALVEEGAQASIFDGANDVGLNIDASGVQVDILVNDDWVGQPESKFTLQEWRMILEQWKYLLQLPKGSDEVVMVKLP